MDAESWYTTLLRDPCVYCGEPADTIDHIIPVADGGPNHWTNYAPACRPCNRAKGGLSVVRFYGGVPYRPIGRKRRLALAAWTRETWQRRLLEEVRLWGVTPTAGFPKLLLLARQTSVPTGTCVITTSNTGIVELISNRGVTSLCD